MASMTPDRVTVDRAYFDTLVRRANYSTHGQDGKRAAGNDDSIVQVPREEYERLILLSHQFANLKNSLLGAGVTEESIATLVQDANGAIPTDPYGVADIYSHDQTDSFEARPPQTKPPTFTIQPPSYTAYGPTANSSSARSYFNTASKPYAFEENSDWASHDHMGGTLTPSHSADGPTDVQIDSLHPTQKPQIPYARVCRRTITFAGLPPYTTLGDVTDVVRGGQLLDVFLRSAEHTASISFVREDDAVRFYEHTRKNDIYIRNKRIFVKWADRHFILPGHVASKVAAGATRNLIIRRCGAHHTEDSVRDDLEHIHNLIVVKVDFIGGSCYIKTNSVHNAMFARTCMMSRAKYKGSKIEWDIDECNQQFEVNQKSSAKLPSQRAPSAKAAVANTRNRFDMLRLDDDDNNDSDDKLDTSSEMPSTVDVAA
ncbi:hypothetical protein F4777DRAFT_574110 [Nemania sp. FL0916]|nr:hypothetical protein F4777DRAFT_574110 [Nemania sp. FL0916]